MISLCLGLKFTLHIPNGIRFPSLKKLVVSEVTFADEMSVQQLFSGCPVLQELTIYDCDWENLERITVSISTLKELTIDFDYYSVDYDHHMKLMIDAVNLLLLSCTCSQSIDIIPVNLTSVVDASIDFEYHPICEPYAAHCVFQLLSGLSSVQSLTLYNNTLEVCLPICSSSSFFFLNIVYHNA